MRPEQVVFAVSPREDGGSDVLLGVTPVSWTYMQDGHTHTFDLTKLGLPIRIVLFGGPDQAAVMGWIEAHNQSLGNTALDDQRARDFSIPPKEPQ